MQNTRQSSLAHLLELEPNSQCSQCGKSSRQWADLSHAIFLCLGCAATYKEFSWVTNIKSIGLDEWSKTDIQRMQKGGNQSFANIMKKYGLQMQECRVKLTSKAAAYYRAILSGNETGEPPSYEQGRTTSKEQIPLVQMKPEQLLQSAKEKALWLGGKTKELGVRGIRKVQHKIESGELKQDAKKIGEKISTKAQWLWGSLREKVGKLTGQKQEQK